VDDLLLDLVCRRLDAVPLRSRASDLLLAAFDGEDALTDVLGGDTREAPVTQDVERREPVGTYLGAVRVAGFRGVGAEATLGLTPGPGLTLVVGRNGSGKSSFAEAVELLVTGRLKRLELHSEAVWRRGWRNIHGSVAPLVEVDLVVEGSRGPTKVRQCWADDAQMAEGTTSVQVAGEPIRGRERLAWDEAAASHRPFLSHAELETMIGAPSVLYDFLAGVLGLEDLTRASSLLAATAKAVEAPLAQAKGSLPQLLEELGALDDERASAVRERLGGRKWDVDGASRLAAGVTGTERGGEIETLRRIAQLTTPDLDEIERTAGALREAGRRLATASGTEAARSRRLADLLDAALDHHHREGDGACPVCGRAGALDAAWRSATEAEVRRLRAEATAADEAHSAAQAAVRSTLRLLAPPPAWLGGIVAGVETDDLDQAWTTWASPPQAAHDGDLPQLARHLESAGTALAAACERASSHAALALAVREDRWAPLAARIASWCEVAAPAMAAAAATPDLKAARQWLMGAIDDLRNDRLAPIAKRSADIWTKLRQESNVELGGIRLSGSGPARHVDFDLSIDGATAPGLGVMSQGEVNALALSVFLPRATLAASPFRFVVIDDPVQAMDPAKVEGLARVLSEFSGDRQVIVFTHDDRLPEATRRLGLAATILEVTRRPDSVVEVREALDPAARALADADALSRDPEVPVEVARRVVAGFCRLALEAVFADATRRRRLGGGDRHADVEDALRQATTLTVKAALGLFDDPARGGDVLGRINQLAGRTGGDAFKAANKSAHGPYLDDLGLLVQDSRDLVRVLRARLT
jgi:recombinational DNA repair ATPase RecF